MKIKLRLLISKHQYQEKLTNINKFNWKKYHLASKIYFCPSGSTDHIQISYSHKSFAHSWLCSIKFCLYSLRFVVSLSSYPQIFFFCTYQVHLVGSLPIISYFYSTIFIFWTYRLFLFLLNSKTCDNIPHNHQFLTFCIFYWYSNRNLSLFFYCFCFFCFLGPHMA